MVQDRLAQGPEEDIHLGQAEAYGLLATITFLSYYINCYNTPIPTIMITCYCDNIGVINTLTSMQNGDIPRPYDTTTDDQAIYLEIEAMASQCASLKYQYLHVKGHQDKNPE